MELSQGGITILGLGPGDPGMITRQAWDILENINELYVRTSQHPALEGLKPDLRINSFDHLYEREETFSSVYEKIVSQILEKSDRPGGVVYAVPGNPFVAEITGLEIYRRASATGIPVHVVPGMSFIDALVVALEIDPFQNLALVDALELEDMHIPPFTTGQPAIIAQIYSRLVASNIKMCLTSLYPDKHPVILVHAAGTSDQKVEQLRLFEIDRSPNTGLFTSLYVPPLEQDTSFESFLDVVARLRAPDGCPWDKEQTHRSLRPYLLEETYELLSALDEDNAQKVREELGDLLLQILLHSQIASEGGEFTISNVLQGINQKIVHRHPHVFSDVDLKDSQSVVRNWERIKQEEKSAQGNENASSLDSVSPLLPALSQADQYAHRAARNGFDWENIDGVWDKVKEELEEVKSAENQREVENEIGDLLFAIVNLARWYHVDAETVLRESNTRFRRRYVFMEEVAHKRGVLLSQMSPAELDDLWHAAKEVQ